MNRRVFIGTSAALVTGAGILGYTTQIEPHWLEIVERDLAIANLPASLKGARLAQISDVHACSYVDEGYITRSLDRVSLLKPDIVVFTGDFVTWEGWRSQAVKEAELKRVLGHFPRGRIATIGILGNHDYGDNWHQYPVADHITAIVREAGIEVLRNEVRTVNGLDFIGIDDLWSGKADTRAALEQRTSAAAIALCHNPDAQDDLDWSGYSGWILAGHTHGGQCKPPFLNPPVLPVNNKRYSAGEITVDANRTLYISRGVGHLLKARFNVRPEITMFTLRDGSPAGA